VIGKDHKDTFHLMDWKSLFSLDVPLLEIILRGSLMYIALFALLRVVLKRQTGSLRMTDLLLITLIADASQNALAGQYQSLSAGIVLVCTILFWSYAFDWLAFKFSWFRRLTEPPPLPLIRDGKLLRKNMRSELITEDELKSQLREQGLEDWEQVQEAFMESDGHVSIVPSKRKQQGKATRKEK
jgi:uncharacterized membrane protein YcaP (DUF421 family)